MAGDGLTFGGCGDDRDDPSDVGGMSENPRMALEGELGGIAFGIAGHEKEEEEEERETVWGGGRGRGLEGKKGYSKNGERKNFGAAGRVDLGE